MRHVVLVSLYVLCILLVPVYAFADYKVVEAVGQIFAVDGPGEYRNSLVCQTEGGTLLRKGMELTEGQYIASMSQAKLTLQDQYATYFIEGAWDSGYRLTHRDLVYFITPNSFQSPSRFAEIFGMTLGLARDIWKRIWDISDSGAHSVGGHMGGPEIRLVGPAGGITVDQVCFVLLGSMSETDLTLEDESGADVLTLTLTKGEACTAALTRSGTYSYVYHSSDDRTFGGSFVFRASSGGSSADSMTLAQFDEALAEGDFYRAWLFSVLGNHAGSEEQEWTPMSGFRGRLENQLLDLQVLTFAEDVGK